MAKPEVYKGADGEGRILVQEDVNLMKFINTALGGYYPTGYAFKPQDEAIFKFKWQSREWSQLEKELGLEA